MSNVMKKRYSDEQDDALFALLRNPQEREAAFGELYTRHSPQIYLYCAKVLWHKQTAEDVFQETFLRFLRSAEVERVMTNVPAYLLRIARNLCLQAKESQKRQFVTSGLEFEPPIHDKAVENSEFEKIMSTALDLLTEEQREAFVLQVYDGLSYTEISEVMEVPVTTVRNWLVRSKRRIAEALQPYIAGNF